MRIEPQVEPFVLGHVAFPEIVELGLGCHVAAENLLCRVTIQDI